MVSKPEFQCLDFWVKIGVFINLNTHFCNLADKVLKYRFAILLVSNLMLNYSTNIYLCRVYLKFSFLPQIRHFDIQVYFVKCTYCYYLYKCTLLC